MQLAYTELNIKSDTSCMSYQNELHVFLRRLFNVSLETIYTSDGRI
jgi:hypothetical protein